jgi:type IX secretion system PorP/SprF family membrane protein
MKRILTYITFFFISAYGFSQQDPQYTQYMYNMSIVNPAYATSKDQILNLGTLYRTQWVGAVGAPKTFTFFAHMPVSPKVQLGFSLISDDIGDGAKKENNFYGDFAYLLQFKNNHRLSLGLKAGFTSLESNFNGFRFETGDTSTDLAFNENVNIFKPNVGMGAYYYTNKYYIGMSVPNLLASRHIEERSGIKAYGSEYSHLFVTGGYVFTLNADFKIKPALMSKFVKGAPPSFDLTTNVLYANKFEVGVAYRYKDAVSGLVNVNVARNVKVGYAYDYTLSNLGQFNSGTHEIFILFDLYLIGKGHDLSPRFF